MPRTLSALGMAAAVSNVIDNVQPHAETSPEAETYEDPKWRLNWFLFQRTYPYESLPSRGRFNALYEPSAAAQPSPQATPPVTTERWRAVGPSPIIPKFALMGVTNGRVNAVAVSPTDPQVVLAGGATGGIWRSADGGTNFAPVSDDQVDLAVGSIAFAPSNASIVYAGMGDVAGGYMGTGVLKSLDGGRSWRRISDESLPAPGTIGNIAVDPTDPDRVYITQYSYRAATGEGEIYASGFFLSEDGGRSWRKTSTGLPRDLAHHPTNPRTLYLSMSTTFAPSPPSAGVYKSVDGGETWRAIFMPSYLEATDIKIAVTPAEPETIYAYTGLILQDSAEASVHVSKDGGATWTDLGRGRMDIGQFGYNSYIRADPSNANTIYIGTRDIYKSTDGGSHWSNVTNNWVESLAGYEFSPSEATSHTDQHALAFSPAAPNVIYVGNDGGLARSRDGGETFESLNATLSVAQFNSITLHPTDASRSCGGTQDNGALVRSPALGQWVEFTPGDSGRCIMNPLDPSILYTSYVFGTLFRFRNNGDTMDGRISDETTFHEPLKEPRIGFYPAFAVHPATGTLYFGTWRLFTSTDRGNNWTAPAGIKDLTKGNTTYGPDVLTVIGVSPSNPDVLYTGSAQGQVMRTRNGGKSWLRAMRGLPRRFITSIVVNPASADEAYLTVSGFGSGHVFKTTDGGDNWTDISPTLKNIPVNALLIAPADPNTLYVGTDVGVFRSLDGGTNWFAFNNGLPPVIVTGFSTQPGGLIQISTYGRGVYELIR
jgi:photosystem II stability/assembly factor-like uncharacterized protein